MSAGFGVEVKRLSTSLSTGCLPGSLPWSCAACGASSVATTARGTHIYDSECFWCWCSVLQLLMMLLQLAGTLASMHTPAAAATKTMPPAAG